jgi:hypothetical protein
MAPMEDVLYTGEVTVDNFQQLVTDCGFPPDAFVLVEQLPERVIRPAERKDLLRFTRLEQDKASSFTNYTTGRIFNEHAELRWERQGNMMLVVYLGSKTRRQVLLNYNLRESKELSKLKQAGERQYFLFGERLSSQDVEKIGSVASPGDFAEVRIPRPLHYPVQQDNKQYVRLIVREYLDNEGRIGLFRFQDLKQWSLQS